MVEEVSLKRKIAQAKKAADSCKNNESWGLVNEVTEQKKKFCGLTEGGSVEGRLACWKNHFVRLLCQPPDVPDDDLDIKQVNPPLSISDWSRLPKKGDPTKTDNCSEQNHE